MATATPSRPLVLLPGTLGGGHQGLPQLLADAGYDVEAYDPTSRESLISSLPTADVVMATPGLRFQFNADLINRAPRLRAVNSLVIGVETIDLAACTEAGVMVANGAVPENFNGVAEATIMLMLGLTLDLKAKERAARTGAWRVSSTRSLLLHGQTIGLIGLGRIGRGIAQRLQGWDVQLLAFDPYVRPDQAPAGVELVSLDDLLRRSHIVSVHVALTGETRNLLGARELGLMQPSAYFINTARGGVVDEAALADAINHGRLAGAAIDTWAQEPTASDNPLFAVDADHTFLTGHNIAHSQRVPGHLVEAAVQNISAELRGEVPPYPVNPAVEARWRARLERIQAEEQPANPRA